MLTQINDVPGTPSSAGTYISVFSFSFKTESNLSKEMELVIKDIKNTTQKKYMDYGKNPGSPDNDFLFMYSVAR